MNRCLLMSVVFTLLVSLATAQNEVKVFVFTAPTPEGFIDQDSKQRSDSVKDVRVALTKKRGLIVVDEKEVADISVEVMGRGWKETGETTTSTIALPPLAGGGLSSRTSADKDMDLVVRLRAGSYETVLHSQNEAIIWRVHAGEIAKKVEKWVKDNNAMVLKLRH